MDLHGIIKGSDKSLCYEAVKKSVGKWQSSLSFEIKAWNGGTVVNFQIGMWGLNYFFCP